jgi:membrane protein
VTLEREAQDDATQVVVMLLKSPQGRRGTKYMRQATAVIKRTLLNLERKHLQLAAAGLAYYFLMSLTPGLLLVTAVIAYLPFQNGTEVATSFLGHVIPLQGVPLIEKLLTNVSSHRGGLLSVGVISTLWLTSKGVKGIIAGLDMVYQVKTPRRVWTNRILAFGLTFAVGVLLLLGVILTLAGPILESLVSKILPVQSLWMRIWPYLQWSLAAIFTFAAVELLYVLAPNVPLARRVTVPGALLAASVWMALSWGVGFFFQYFGSTKLDRFYGIMATPITLAIWLYWGALGMLVGAEINLSLQSLRSTKKDEPAPVSPSRAA